MSHSFEFHTSIMHTYVKKKKGRKISPLALGICKKLLAIYGERFVKSLLFFLFLYFFWLSNGSNLYKPMRFLPDNFSPIPLSFYLLFSFFGLFLVLFAFFSISGHLGDSECSLVSASHRFRHQRINFKSIIIYYPCWLL